MLNERKKANSKLGIYKWGCQCCVPKSTDLKSHQSAKSKTEWRKLTHRLERRIAEDILRDEIEEFFDDRAA